MATDKQVLANRRNALRSTGPRSRAGKLRSSKNALTHGLSAQQIVIGGEDPLAYEKLRAALYDQFNPAGVLEEHTADYAASVLWRMLRIGRLEAAILEQCRSSKSIQRPASLHEQRKVDFVAIYEKARADAWARAAGQAPIDELDQGDHSQQIVEKSESTKDDSPLVLDSDTSDLFLKLQRIEHSLGRTFERTMARLLLLQNLRKNK